MTALLNGGYGRVDLIRYGRPAVSLRDRMPPVYQQALRGTCVANAATALLEYFEDCKSRLSVQFLHEMTKSLEREWLDRNLRALEENRDVDADFAAKFPAQVAQIRLTSDANGAGSPAAKAFVSAFARQLGGYFNSQTGSQIKRCFEAIREYGTCRYSLWPYANVQTDESVAGTSLPPGSREDALKHRVQTGLYLLRSPNNVEEIRGILAGENGRRPMPVCIALPLFEGCDGERFKFPETHEEDGRLVGDNALRDVHEMLVVGFEDDKKALGGGWFEVRNSWGANWGNDGYGKVPYAYVECFCTEAGTILQDMVDYVGDGYGAVAGRSAGLSAQRVTGSRRFVRFLAFAGLTVSAAALAVLVMQTLVPETIGRREAVAVDPPKTVSVTNAPKAQEDLAREAERLRQEMESKRRAEENRLAEERRQTELKRAAEERAAEEARNRRLAEEKRLAEERAALEAEKAKLAQERRAAEERAAEAAREKRLAEEKAAREAEQKRRAEEKAALEAEKARLEQEQKAAEKRQAEAKRLAEEKAAQARAKSYRVRVTVTCFSEEERDAVVKCLNRQSARDVVDAGVTNAVSKVTVGSQAAGRNLFGVVKTSYLVRCDVTLSDVAGTVRVPTEHVKRFLGTVLNESCQIEGEDRIDWTTYTRSQYQQDIRTVSEQQSKPKKSNSGVSFGF